MIPKLTPGKDRKQSLSHRNDEEQSDKLNTENTFSPVCANIGFRPIFHLDKRVAPFDLVTYTVIGKRFEECY